MVNQSFDQSFSRSPPMMAMTQQENTKDTRRRLMEAALRVFAAKGYDGAGVREIAENAKANPAMIAYHFGGKEGLYVAALRWIVSDFFQWLQNASVPPNPDSTDARAQALAGLVAAIRGLFQNLGVDRGNPERKSLHEAAIKLWGQELANPRPALLDYILGHFRIMAGSVTSFLSVLRPDLSKLELSTMVFNIYGPVFFFSRTAHIFQKMHNKTFSDDDLERLSRHFVDYSLRGLGLSDGLAKEGA